MPMSAPILRCSDHHLFHFGRGDRERDGEGGSVGRELSPHAFLFESIRNSGSFTSSSLSLTQWRARKRFQMLRKSRGKCLEHRIEYSQVDPKWSKGPLVIPRSKYIQILFIPIDWYLLDPVQSHSYWTYSIRFYRYILRLCHCGFRLLVFQRCPEKDWPELLQRFLANTRMNNTILVFLRISMFSARSQRPRHLDQYSHGNLTEKPRTNMSNCQTVGLPRNENAAWTWKSSDSDAAPFWSRGAKRRDLAPMSVGYRQPAALTWRRILLALTAGGLASK